MKARTTFSACAAAQIILLAADGAAGAAELRDEIIVTDTRKDALADALAAAEAKSGNVDFVPAEEFNKRFAVTLRDALAFSPGVVMQPSAGEDGRMSIRGSALANNFHLRGVELLINGVPINAADGFGDFQEVDALFASHINVIRGANAMTTGAAVLGGAVEIETLTAQTAENAISLRAEGGSFGTSRLNGAAAKDFGRYDAFVAATWQRQDGFRDHAQQRNERIYANFGAQWSDRASTRLGVFLNDIDQELAGSVSLAGALNDPQSAAPQNVAQNWRRNMRSARAFTSTTIAAGSGEFTFGGSYARKSLFHPIVVFILQDSDDFTGFGKYEVAGEAAGLPVALTAGMRFRHTDLDSSVFGNFSGAQGPLFSDSRQRSRSIEGYGELRVEVVKGLEAIVGATGLSTRRNYDDKLNDAEDDRLNFKEASPRFGLLYRPSSDVQLFANASASYEAPAFGDLTQAGIAGFTPIEAQDAFTYEIGARGRVSSLAFEFALYRADIDGEFVAFTTAAGVPAPIFNADKSRHQGIELFLGYDFSAETRGYSITPRLSYSFNDFQFVDDPIFGNNQLAGLPRHIGRAEVDIRMRGLRIAPNVIFQSGRNFVDYANTLQSPGHALIGVEASYEISPSAVLFLDARNLADEAYILNYSTVADASIAPTLNVFIPGEGRAIFGGLRIGFGGKP